MDFTQTIGVIDNSSSGRTEIFRVKQLGWYVLSNNGLRGPYKSWLGCQVAIIWSSQTDTELDK